MFKIILKFLRSGKLVDCLTKGELSELQDEADYFQLSSLVQIIKERLGCKSFIVKSKLRTGEEDTYCFEDNGELFGNIPLPVIVETFKKRVYTNCIQDYIILAESVKHVNVERDANSKICVNIKININYISDTIDELKKKQYDANLTKAFVYLRDYYFAKEKDEVKLYLGGQVFMCKKSALFYADAEIIDEHGQLYQSCPRICPRQRGECVCKEAHALSVGDLVGRILTRLQNNRKMSKAPSKKTEVNEDSNAAQKMRLLPQNRWFN